MLHSAADAADLLKHGQSLLGPGWREAQSFDDVSDPEDYSETEEEEYVVLDLGSTADTRSLQAESSYQLIGMDTPMPFLKIGNQVYQGQVTPLIGDEVILEHRREYDRPAAKPSHPPFAVSVQRLTFRAVKLHPRVASQAQDMDVDEAPKEGKDLPMDPQERARRALADKKSHFTTRSIFVQPRGRGGPSTSASASAGVSRQQTPVVAISAADSPAAASVTEAAPAVAGEGGQAGEPVTVGAQPDASGLQSAVPLAVDALVPTVPPDQPALEAEDWFDDAIANIDPALRTPAEGSRNTSVAPVEPPQPPAEEPPLASLPANPVPAAQPAPPGIDAPAATATPPPYIPFISSSSHKPNSSYYPAPTLPRKVGRPRKEHMQIFDISQLMDIDVSQLNAKSRIELLPHPMQPDDNQPGLSTSGFVAPLQVFTKTQVMKFQAGLPLSGKGSRGRRSSALGGRGTGTSRLTPGEGFTGSGEEHEDGDESGGREGASASDLPEIPGLPPGLVIDRRIAVRLAKAEKRRKALLEKPKEEVLGDREFVIGGMEEVAEALRQAEAEGASAGTASADPRSAADGEDTGAT